MTTEGTCGSLDVKVDSTSQGCSKIRYHICLEFWKLNDGKGCFGDECSDDD